MGSTTALQVAKFIVGQIYSMRSPCDHNCVWSFRVIARTAKRVVLQSTNCMTPEEKTAHIRLGVKVWNDQETCLPLGRYSMSPILRA